VCDERKIETTHTIIISSTIYILYKARINFNILSERALAFRTCGIYDCCRTPVVGGALWATVAGEYDNIFIAMLYANVQGDSPSTFFDVLSHFNAIYSIKTIIFENVPIRL